MKRSIICASALIAGSFAFAQSPMPTIPGATKSTIAAPTQKVSPVAGATQGGNYSDIVQSGLGSDATVEQQGTDQASFITQTGTSQSVRNSVNVEQRGNVDPGTILSGFKNYAEISQVGAGNGFNSVQLGDKNEVFGVQNGDRNTALVQQGDLNAQQAEMNTALVTQEGLRNDAEVQQRYDNNESSIFQKNDATTGVRNRSYQEQTANPNLSSGHTAIGTQYGDSNDLVQIQRGPAVGASVGNYAESNQGDATTDAINGFVQQVQTGIANEAYATQFGENNNAFQEQMGENNVAQVKQNTNPQRFGENRAEQYQDGSDNSAYIDQNGTDHRAFQEQYGTNHESIIMQRAGQVAGNFALSIQSGDDHYSAITQNLDRNRAIVDQTGNGQTSVIRQNASQNAANRPAGFNSASVIQRNGNGSLAPQSQRAKASKRRF